MSNGIEPVNNKIVQGVASDQVTNTKKNPNSTAAAKNAPVPTPPPTTDTVQLSNSAKAAMQEATETPAQTAQEARNGDRQAKRLMAKEAAEAAQAEGKQ